MDQPIFKVCRLNAGNTRREPHAANSLRVATNRDIRSSAMKNVTLRSYGGYGLGLYCVPKYL